MTNDIIAQVDKYIQDEMETHHIPGLSLALVQDGTPHVMKGYGQANVEWSIPATADTVYEIASITKLFTATAVMMLVEEGLLTLDDPISAYLLTLPATWSDITLQHILSHQSGIKGYTQVEAYWQTTRLDVPREEILNLVTDRPLNFQPGERYAYDNTGYYLLGMLIEKVSGESYGDYLKKRIFEPLEMTATQVNDPYTIVANRAAGYTYLNGTLTNSEYYSPSGTYSSGILLSTVSDLAKWAATLYTDKLLSESSRQQMWTSHVSHPANY